MPLAYAEYVMHAPETPFIDGENLRYFERETAWRVSADQDGATFTCMKPEDYTYFSANRGDLVALVRMCPGVRELFEYGETPEGFKSFRIPTLGRANAFAAERFSGLPTAGIQAFQEKDMGNTCAPGYLYDLVDEVIPKLPVSFGHERHFHDLIGHWLGAATVDDDSFTVFKALARDALSLWGNGPQWPHIHYVGALARAFDQFTDAQIRQAMTSTTDRDGYLLGYSLNSIRVRHPAALPRAISILEGYGMDVVVPSRYESIIVPWEMDHMPAYYERVAAELR